LDAETYWQVENGSKALHDEGDEFLERILLPYVILSQVAVILSVR